MPLRPLYAANGGTGDGNFGNGANTDAQKRANGTNKWGGSTGSGYTNFTKEDHSGNINKNKTYYGDKKAYEVYVHGDGEGGVVDQDGNPLSVDEVYKQMQADGYQSGTPIYLISCGSALGSNPQDLSGQADAQVTAPLGANARVEWGGRNWVMTSVPYYRGDPQNWVRFSPDGPPVDLGTRNIEWR
jgi:hypothetical protein